MQTGMIGMIGLGRMGSRMVRRLLEKGVHCAVHDPQPDAVARAVAQGAVGAATLAELTAQLAPPRTLWLMVPAAIVDSVLEALVPLLQPGDTVIDGGNSYYQDNIRRAARLQKSGLHYVDVGTSGGVAGLDRGYCQMIGGEDAVVRRLIPIFAALAPGEQAAAPTPGRTAGTSSADQGFLHCGPHGAGHFVKMVHNGIEYGMMQAYAEGLNILHHANVGQSKPSQPGQPGHASAAGDAETTPLRHPEFYQYALDLPNIAEVWRRGSVISSWLLDLTAAALAQDPQLKSYSGRVSDSGEGRWTLAAAIDEAVPAPVLSAALYARFASRGEAGFADQLLSAMRHGFGGHLEKTPDKEAP